MRYVKHILTASLALALFAIATRAEDGDQPKHTIKEIMEIAHKGRDSLYRKVSAGKASADEKKELAELYAELVKNTPKKGSAEDWKERSEALAKAAKNLADDKPNALAALKMVNKCGDCHKAHK